MTDKDVAKEGGCRCGRLRFRVTSRPLITMACHCTGCQRMTASAFSLSTLYPSDGFEILQGEPVIGGLHGTSRHFFCAFCMSWVFTRPAGLDDLVNVRSTMFDDAHDFVPFVETYTSEMLPWAKTPAPHSFEKFPPAEKFPELLAAFAQWGDQR
ncbi:GFA family protein [Microvirga puerhi]|uniref:GFA family protein n=1 Tax=Microvirga puerhi TaxID=2876078 RepID=A0ABS7VLQ7_9HYPH|nr:GFA family protein [Microvirga puerhi]MBZ6076474.1 GFA family protein [Microvirga puerhi]